jgi:hypothetical protein
METRSADRFDSLARWTARRAGIRHVTRGRVEPESSAATGGEPGLSRTRVLRLGLAGAASVLVAGYRPTRALAQDRNECLTQCYDRYARAADRDVSACESLYNDPKSYVNSPQDWRRIRALIDRGGWGVFNDFVNRVLWEACEARALNRMKQGFTRCEDACRETCPQPGGRTPSAVISALTCHGTHPPPASKPTPPPPPNPANDVCAACVEVGGVCCGSCPRDPNVAPCLTLLTTGETAGDCNEALSRC